eukprot:TRINITY_DN6563_c0_g2_i1.p1 TRINITY_DN6563_c0_g2~~TRINITY_DN6563_c0_g2_i1.p1  ORF type:complete len:114 (+),score=37.89 TRINITY_DN6563_c0_g2_i1:84-425(+)
MSAAAAAAVVQTRDVDPVDSSDDAGEVEADPQQQEHDVCNGCKRRRVGLKKQVKPIVKREVKKVIRPLVAAVTNAVVDYILSNWEHSDHQSVEAEPEGEAAPVVQAAVENNIV